MQRRNFSISGIVQIVGSLCISICAILLTMKDWFFKSGGCQVLSYLVYSIFPVMLVACVVFVQRYRGIFLLAQVVVIGEDSKGAVIDRARLFLHIMLFLGFGISLQAADDLVFDYFGVVAPRHWFSFRVAILLRSMLLVQGSSSLASCLSSLILEVWVWLCLDRFHVRPVNMLGRLICFHNYL